MSLHNINHIYILCDKSYELNRYNFLLKWAQDNFDSSYYSFNMYCYKDTIHKKDISRYGLMENRLKPSEISLFINYMKLFEDITDKYSTEKNGHFLILESDVIPQENWKSILTSQMENLENISFDFLHVGNGGNNDFLPSLFGHVLSPESNIYPCPSARCTEAMIWSYSGASKYLSFKHKPVIHPMDFYFNTIAANGIKTIEETKSFWGHPVAFIQGTANGTYESTVNDSIQIPDRLSFYKKQLNIHFDKDLFHFEDFIKYIIKTSFPDTHVTHYPNRKAQLLITSKHSQTHPYIFVRTLNRAREEENTSLKVLELSLYETFEKGVYHIPEICLSPLIWDLDKLLHRFLSSKKSLSISNGSKSLSPSINYILKNINNSTDFIPNSVFRFCLEDEYHPGQITSQILDAYFDGCIPVFYGCNIIVSELFDKSTYINLSDFNNDNQVIKFIKMCINNKNQLQSFFTNNPIKPNTILTWAQINNNNSIIAYICTHFHSKYNQFYSHYINRKLENAT